MMWICYPKWDWRIFPAQIQFKTGTKRDITLSGVPSTLYEYEAGTNGLYYYRVIMPPRGS